MTNQLDVEAMEEAARKRRFHEHTSTLVAALELAYMAAGRALTRTRIDDKETRAAIGSQMDSLSAMATTAKRMRDQEA